MKKKSGPKPKGYVKVLVNIPVAYLAAMKAKNAECGGMYPVNEQIRIAIRGFAPDEGYCQCNPSTCGTIPNTYPARCSACRRPRR